MKKDTLVITAAALGIIALAALLLSSRFAVRPDSLGGIVTVGSLLAIGALEYRPFRR